MQTETHNKIRAAGDKSCGPNFVVHIKMMALFYFELSKIFAAYTANSQAKSPAVMTRTAESRLYHFFSPEINAALRSALEKPILDMTKAPAAVHMSACPIASSRTTRDEKPKKLKNKKTSPP